MIASFIAEARKALIVLWNNMTNASARARWGVLILLILGVLGELAAPKYLRIDSASRSLVQGFSDAFVITGLLAILVDPYMKRRMQEEAAWTAIFGYLNQNAPESLREALKELATCTRYYTKAAWTVQLDWLDETKRILVVTMTVEYTGVNLDLKPYRPNGKPWVLASTDDYESEYLQYSLHCTGHITPVDIRGENLKPYVMTQDDGSICVDESRLAAGRAIPSGVTFENVNQARMYRHANGYVPLQHNKYIESIPITLAGSALADLDVRITHPRQEGRRVPSEWKRFSSSKKNPESQTFGRATPGQITLVSWVPANNTTKTSHPR